MPISGTSITRFSCIQRILLGIKLSFCLSIEQLQFDNQNTQWNCIDFLNHVTVHSHDHINLSSNKSIQNDQTDYHCCVESPFFIRVIFSIGRLFLPERIKSSGLEIEESRIHDLIIESLWIFLAPWIGTLSSFQIQRPSHEFNSELKFRYCPPLDCTPFLPPFVFPLLSDAPVEIRNISPPPPIPILDFTLRTIFWCLINASLLPLSPPPSNIPFIDAVDGYQFRTLMHLRDLVQNMIRSHLRSQTIHPYIYSSWASDLLISNESALQVFRTTLSYHSTFPSLPFYQTLLSLPVESCDDRQLNFQYYELALHFLVIVANSGVSIPSSDPLISQFQKWILEIFSFSFICPDVLNNRAVLKKILLMIAQYSSLLCYSNQAWNNSMNASVRSLLVGQHELLFISLRSKEDHAGAVAMMKLIKAAAKQNTIDIIASESFNVAELSSMLESCLNSAQLLGDHQLSHLLLQELSDTKSNSFRILFSSLLQLPTDDNNKLPLVPSSYTIVLASWSFCCRLLYPATAPLLLRPLYKSIIRCLSIYKIAASSYDSSHQLTLSEIISLSRRIQLAAKCAEALIAAAVGDKSSLVLNSIGMIKKKDSDFIQANNSIINRMICECLVPDDSLLVMIEALPFWSDYFQSYISNSLLNDFNQVQFYYDQMNSTLESITSLIACNERISSITITQLLQSYHKLPLLPFWYKPLSTLHLDPNNFSIVANKLCNEFLHAASVALPLLHPTPVHPSTLIDGLNAFAQFFLSIDISKHSIGFSILPNFFILNCLFLRCKNYLNGVSLSSLELLTEFLTSIVSQLSNPLLPSSEFHLVQSAIIFLRSELSLHQFLQILSIPIPAESTPAHILITLLQNQTIDASLNFDLQQTSVSSLFRLQTNTLQFPSKRPKWIEVLTSSILQCLSSEVPFPAATANLVESIRLLFIISSNISTTDQQTFSDEINSSDVQDLLMMASWLIEIQIPLHSTVVSQLRWSVSNSTSSRHFIKEIIETQRGHLTVHNRRSQLKTVLRKFCGRGGVVKDNMKDE